MESRGHGRRGCPRGSSRPPPGFDQQAFLEAMGTKFIIIARLVQLAVKEGQVTSRGLERIILLRSEGEVIPYQGLMICLIS